MTMIAEGPISGLSDCLCLKHSYLFSTMRVHGRYWTVPLVTWQKICEKNGCNGAGYGENGLGTSLTIKRVTKLGI